MAKRTRVTTRRYRFEKIRTVPLQTAAAVRFAVEEYGDWLTPAGRDFVHEFADRIEAAGIEELFI